MEGDTPATSAHLASRLLPEMDRHAEQEPVSDHSRGCSSDTRLGGSWVVPDCSQTESSSDKLSIRMTVCAAPSGGQNPANQIMFSLFMHV